MLQQQEMFTSHQQQTNTAPIRLKAISKQGHKAVVWKYRQERRFRKMLQKYWELNRGSLLYFSRGKEAVSPASKQDHSSMAIPCCEAAVATRVIMTWLGLAWHGTAKADQTEPTEKPYFFKWWRRSKKWIVLWALWFIAPLQTCTVVCWLLLEVKRYNKLFLVPIHTNIAPIKLQYQHLTKTSHALENTNIWGTVKAEKWII